MGASITAGRGHLKRTAFTITFDGTAGKGAQGAVPLFTTTGAVLISYIVGICTVTLTQDVGTPTLSFGVTGGIEDFVAATTATDIDVNEIWTSTSPSSNGKALPGGMIDIVIVDDIICTVAGTNKVDGGAIRFAVYYLPLSSDGALS